MVAGYLWAQYVVTGGQTGGQDIKRNDPRWELEAKELIRRAGLVAIDKELIEPAPTEDSGDVQQGVYQQAVRSYNKLRAK